MSPLLWIIAGPIAALGLWIIVLNWCRYALMARHFRRTGQRRFISSTPIAGPVLLTIAWLVGTFDGHAARWRWVWVAWVIDEGTWIMLYGLVYWFVLRPIGVRNVPGYRDTGGPPTPREDA